MQRPQGDTSGAGTTNIATYRRPVPKVTKWTSMLSPCVSRSNCATLLPQGKAEKVKDKKLKSSIKRSDAKVLLSDNQCCCTFVPLTRYFFVQARSAAYAAARAEILLPEEAGFLEAEGMERTYKFSQKALREEVDISSSRKVLNIVNHAVATIITHSFCRCSSLNWTNTDHTPCDLLAMVGIWH